MGKMGAEVLVPVKKIAPLRHIGIKKTKLISTPESRAVLEAKPIEIPLSSTEQADDENK
jgi:ribosomal protein S3AE